METKDPKRSKKAMIAKTNCHLLRCYILLGMSSPDYELALHSADLALDIAQMRNLWRLEAKAQRLRGHCFKGMGKWREAYNCYVRSASALDGVGNVGELTRECLEKLERNCDEAQTKRLKHPPHQCGIKAHSNKEYARERGVLPEKDHRDKPKAIQKVRLVETKGSCGAQVGSSSRGERMDKPSINN